MRWDTSSRAATVWRRRVMLIGLLFAGACSESGGGFVLEVETQEANADFGVVRADIATTRSVTIQKPFVPSGEVVLVAATGPFTAPTLPASVDQGIDVSLPVTYVPGSETTGRLSLRFTSGSGLVQDVELTLTTRIESPSGNLLATSHDFGKTAVGERITRSIILENPNQVTPIEITGASALPAGLTFRSLIDAFPILVLPGRSQTIGTLSFAPESVGDVSDTLALANSIGPDFEMTVQGEGMPSELVLDLGPVTVDPSTAESPDLQFDVPPEAVSISIHVESVPGEIVFAAHLVGPGGQVFIDESAPFDGPYIWDRGLIPPFSRLVQIPNTDRPDVQLVPGGGTYEFRVIASDPGPLDVQVVIEQRNVAGRTESVLDLNVFLADGIAPDAATAATDPVLQDLLARIDATFAQVDLRLGDVTYYDVTDPTLDDMVDSVDIDRLFLESGVVAEERLNLFFVRSIGQGGGDLDPNLVGRAGAIGGARKAGRTYSGVVSLYDSTRATEVGFIAAHEVGHYLGLFHTVENPGAPFTHDFIDDTLECPLSFTDSACTTLGAAYLMHPFVLPVPDPILTPGQGKVMRAHAFVRPGTPAAPPGPMASTRPLLLATASEWCGTCREAHAR